MPAECTLEQIDNTGPEPAFRPYAGVDAHLSLRFETKAIWPKLKSALGVDECGAAIALDVYSEALTTGRKTAYSRAKRHYAALAANREKWQNRDTLYAHSRVLPAVGMLERNGWIDHWKAAVGQYDEQSTIRATPALVDTVRGLVKGGLSLTACRPSAGLILRDEFGHQMPFSKTAQTKRMERNVEIINEGLRSMRLEGAFPACVMRIANESIERGCRFYMNGGSLQIQPEHKRLQVLIDGERVSEVDFKTLHLSMIYSDAGITPPDDSYSVEGWPRELAKVAMLVLINAKTYGEAIGAIAHDDQMIAMAFPGSQEAFHEAANLIGALKRLHRPIRKAFHSGAGAFLMRRESDVMEDVMLAMLRKGESVLPIHDSAIVRTSRVGYLEEAMTAAAARAGLKLRLETTHSASNDVV